MPHCSGSDPECVIVRNCMSGKMLHARIHSYLSLTHLVATATTCSLAFSVAMCCKNRETGYVGKVEYISTSLG